MVRPNANPGFRRKGRAASPRGANPPGGLREMPQERRAEDTRAGRRRGPASWKSGQCPFPRRPREQPTFAVHLDRPVLLRVVDQLCLERGGVGRKVLVRDAQQLWGWIAVAHGELSPVGLGAVVVHVQEGQQQCPCPCPWGASWGQSTGEGEGKPCLKQNSLKRQIIIQRQNGCFEKLQAASLQRPHFCTPTAPKSPTTSCPISPPRLQSTVAPEAALSAQQVPRLGHGKQQKEWGTGGHHSLV